MHSFNINFLKSRPALSCLLSFLAGSLAAASMAPLSFWPVLFLSFPLLYLLVVQAYTMPRAFLIGWLFGFGYFVFGLYWIGNALLVEGNPYRWVWPLAVIGLPFLLAFFPAFACALAKRFTNLNSIGGFIAFTAYLAGFEWIRGYAFSGFPWNLYGYAWADIHEITQIVALSDIYALTWLTILWASCLGFIINPSPARKSKWLIISIAAMSMVITYVYGYQRLAGVENQSHQDIAVKIVQANIPQAEKWQPDKMHDHLRRHLELSRFNPADEAAGTTIIVWPETALHYRFWQNPMIRDQISNMLSAYPGHAFLATGYLHREEETYTNSLALIDGSGDIVHRYDKSHLVPFGEYIPFQNLIPLTTITGFTGFQSGEGPVTQNLPNYTQKKIGYSPSICYEAIFPHRAVNEEFLPYIIINVTNDGWYGKSAGPYQHFIQARFRAIETGIPLVRAANTGISGIIDSYGRSIKKTALQEQGRIYEHLPVAKSLYRNELYRAFFLLFLALMIFLGYVQKK